MQNPFRSIRSSSSHQSSPSSILTMFLLPIATLPSSLHIPSTFSLPVLFSFRSNIMPSKSTHHCSFSAIVEFTDAPRVQRGSIVVIPATLQGPLWTVPDLRIIGDNPLEIVFY